METNVDSIGAYMPEPEIHSHYRDEAAKREAFLDFVPKIFPSVSFRKWHETGSWPDRYIPYSLFIDDQLISNVSISHMEILVDGQMKRGIQFSAVGTLPDHRNKGYARRLLSYIIDRYREDTDFFFLFANETVLDFYPKFGFRPLEESLFSYGLSEVEAVKNYSKLDINHAPDWATLKRMAANRIDLTEKFGAADYEHILLWQVLNFPEIEIRYVPGHDVAFLVEEDHDILNVYDILSVKDFSFLDIIPSVLGENSRTLHLHFTPEKLGIETKVLPYADDSPLFIWEKDPGLEAMQPFKFPVLAQT